MFTESELNVLRCINSGCMSVSELKKRSGLSQAQVYNILRELKDKSMIKEAGPIEISDNVCAIRLANLLSDHPNLSNVLSGSGIDILLMLLGPHTANDVVCELGISRSVVFKKLKKSMMSGIIIHSGDQYQVNTELWPDLTECLKSIIDQRSVLDKRIPNGSRILINKKEYVVYSNGRDTGDRYTAFSFFEKEGLPIALDTNYYSTKDDVDLNIAFRDAYEITERLNYRRFRMAVLMEYAENRDKIDPPVNFRKIIDRIQNNVSVPGWPSMEEVKQRNWNR